PGPVTVRPSRFSFKWWFFLLGSLFFLATGISLILDGRVGSADWLTWVGFALFGAIALASASALIPGGVRLTLDRAGFQSVAFFRSRQVRWEDVSDFKDYGLVGVVFENAKKTNSPKAYLDSLLSGRNDYLPDTYGLWAHDLVALMTKWRELALK